MGAATAVALSDGLTNVISGVGTSQDKNVSNVYSMGVIDQGQVEAAYRTSWLMRKVIDLPPFDMVREWRDWQADKDQIEKLEAEEKRLKVRHKIKRALTLARLHGGGVIILGFGDADPTKPAPKVTKAGGLKFLTVMSRYQVRADTLETDPMSEYFGEPKAYGVTGPTGEVMIHPSRVIPFIGQPNPEGAIVTGAGNDAFWGDPLFLSIESAIKNSDLSQAVIPALMQEAKTDTVKIPDLTELVSTAEGEARFMKRLTVAGLAKSVFNTRVYDAAEDWQTFTLTFAGLNDIARLFLQIVAGAADIPATRLLGVAPQGMNATGDGDADNYDMMISAKQESDLRPALDRLDAFLIPSALGNTPPDVGWTFAPLKQMSEEKKAAIGKIKAETTQIYANGGLIPDVALAKAVQNQLVEDGQYPGLDSALAEAEAAGEVASILEELEEVDPSALQAPANGNEPEQDPAMVAPFDMRGAVMTGDLLKAMNRTAAAASVIGDRGHEVHASLWTRAMDAIRKVLGDAGPRPLYVSRKLVNADEFLTWAKGQGFKASLSADDLHVTILYSRQAVDWMKMGDNWSSDQNGNLTVPAGGARIVEPLGTEGAVVLLFSSTDLQWRHRNMVEAGASHDYEEFQPHVTITYDAGDVDLAKVEPFRGKLVFGPEIFEEIRQ